jgi:hypothetical protein
MSRLFTYVITHDAGFAPNPFYGVLTLNFCKPLIRRTAEVGDWVAANTAANFPGGRGLLVYAARGARRETLCMTSRPTPRPVAADLSTVRRI